jgi:hypothetical protein
METASAVAAERLREAVVELLRQSYFGDDTLLARLDRLMLGDEPEARLAEIRQSSRSAVCAKMFTSGEAAYQCRTCGVDPTCIQCTACFRLANHKGHDIKMTTAGGGGICDCGDASSWAPEGNCSAHGGVHAGGVDPTLALRADVRATAPVVVETVVAVLGWAIAHRNNCWTVPGLSISPKPFWRK